MLYYYDMHRLVVWAHTAHKKIAAHYANIVKPVKVPISAASHRVAKLEAKGAQAPDANITNMLITSLNRTDPIWASSGMIQEYETRLSAMNDLFDGVYKKKKTPRPPADTLPVGHFLAKIPKFYVIGLGGWISDSTYSAVDDQLKENDIAIGYDERSKTGMSIKFKVRPPLQRIKTFKDKRLMERGTICATKNKHALQELCNKLDIHVDKKDFESIQSICDRIRATLIYRELKARMDGTHVKWFYFVYERQKTMF